MGLYQRKFRIALIAAIVLLLTVNVLLIINMISNSNNTASESIVIAE